MDLALPGCPLTWKQTRNYPMAILNIGYQKILGNSREWEDAKSGSKEQTNQEPQFSVGLGLSSYQDWGPPLSLFRSAALACAIWVSSWMCLGNPICTWGPNIS